MDNVEWEVNQDRSERAWYVSYTVLVGLVMLAVAPFAVLGIAKAHFGRDPARGFVPWLKAALGLFMLTLDLQFVHLVIATCLAYNTGIERNTVRAALHLGFLAELFATLSAAAVMVFLLELGPGMHRAIEGIGSTFDRAIRIFAYALAFVVAALAISYYGLLVDMQVNGSNHMDDINNLIATTAIILFFASLVITALSVYTWIHRKASPLKQASVLYLIASLLNLVSSTWKFAYAVNWLLMDNYVRPYVPLLTILLAWWTRGMLLALGFIIAVRTGPKGGVWSSHGAAHKSGHSSLMGGSTARNSHATDGTRDGRV